MSAVIYIDAGGSATIEYALLNAAGDPLDLTGYTLTFRIGPDGGLTYIEKTPTVTDAAGGLASVYLSESDVDLLATQLLQGTLKHVAHVKVDPGGASPQIDIIKNDVLIEWTLYA